MPVKVIDQDCQTSVRQCDFFVSIFGELSRINKAGESILPKETSILNLAELAASSGFDWKEVCLYREGVDRGSVALRWFKCLDDEWERRHNRLLTATEYAFARKVFAFQDAISPGRFHVYGQKAGADECIVLVIELLGVVDDDELWTNLLKIKDDLSAHLWIMDETENREHSYKTHGPPNYEKIEGSDENSPNYGKIERQVELSWRIEDLTTDQVVELQQRIEAATDALWPAAGVAVF